MQRAHKAIHKGDSPLLPGLRDDPTKSPREGMEQKAQG
jgi:hypothetical protein